MILTGSFNKVLNMNLLPMGRYFSGTKCLVVEKSVLLGVKQSMGRFLGVQMSSTAWI